MRRCRLGTKTQFYEFLVVESCISLNMQYLQSLLKFKIFKIKILKYFLFIYSMSLSRYVMLKLSKTSPKKLFPSDCITLYIVCTGYPAFLVIQYPVVYSVAFAGYPDGYLVRSLFDLTLILILRQLNA